MKTLMSCNRQRVNGRAEVKLLVSFCLSGCEVPMFLRTGHIVNHLTLK